jgi:hypothetical protein
MGRKRILKQKELLENIRGSYGIISTIAARLHCDWHTVDNAIKLYPDCMRALEDEKESVLDFTEGKAIERIRDGDGAMIRFMLATKGKKRGYTYEERLEDPDGNDDESPLNIICDGEEVDPQPIGFNSEIEQKANE